MYVPLKLNINTFLGLTGFADACSLKKYVHLLFVRITVTTIIIVIKIKTKIYYFTSPRNYFYYFFSSDKHKNTKRNKTTSTVPVDVFDRRLSRAHKG